MNTLYNNLVKSFSAGDWKSCRWYRDEIKAYSRLEDVRKEIKENNGDAKLQQFDAELKKIKKKGKIKTALAILSALAGIGLMVNTRGRLEGAEKNINSLKEEDKKLRDENKQGEQELWENDNKLAKGIYDTWNDNQSLKHNKINYDWDDHHYRWEGPKDGLESIHLTHPWKHMLMNKWNGGYEWIR